MDFRLTEEQRLVQATAKDFVDKEIIPHNREWEEKGEIPRSWYAKMAELGFLGAPVPEKYGGAGMDYVSFMLLLEEISRGSSSLRTTVSVQTSLSETSLLWFADEEQKQKWLVPLAKGEKLGAWALTEPEAGSDAANLSTNYREEGDEVVYPNPGFPIYESMIRFLGATAVPLRLREEMGFRFDPEELKSLIGPRTRLIILNSPQNPTGGALTPEETERAAALLADSTAWVLSDEVYSQMVYDGEFASVASHPGLLERTILLDGFSKTYAMTGWRLGYAVVPEALAFGFVDHPDRHAILRRSARIQIIRLHVNFGLHILGHAVQPDQRRLADCVEDMLALHLRASLLKICGTV